MDKKRMIAVIYIDGDIAVRSFEDKSLFRGDIEALTLEMSESDIDAILCFDVSDKADPFAHERSLISLGNICKNTSLPVYGGGHIESLTDVEAIFERGCSKVILNFAKESAQLILESMTGIYEKDRIAATIASEDNLVINRTLLESGVGELILIDEHALKNCLGASVLPCVVFLPEISLDKMFSIMGKDNVSGISGDIVNENITRIPTLKKLCQEQGINVTRFEPLIPFSELKKGADGLVPCIVQDVETGEVLMMAWMNEEAYLKTLRTGRMTYYSRSRKTLWVKGETSGHFQYVKRFSIDCDNDTLLAQVKQIGAACHTGNHSCFYRDLIPAAIDVEEKTGIDEAKLREQTEALSDALLKANEAMDALKGLL